MPFVIDIPTVESLAGTKHLATKGCDTGVTRTKLQPTVLHTSELIISTTVCILYNEFVAHHAYQ